MPQEVDATRNGILWTLNQAEEDTTHRGDMYTVSPEAQVTSQNLLKTKAYIRME